MRMNKIVDDILKQRDFRIPGNVKIKDYIRSPACSEDFLSSDIVMVLSLHGRIFELNLLGSIIFEGIADAEPSSAILTDILNLFEVDAKQVQTEYQLFVADLEKKGFIQQSDE